MQEGIFDLTPKSTKTAKKHVNKKRKLPVFIFCFAVFAYFLISLTNYFSSVIVDICHAQVQSLTMSAVNKAIIEVMSQSISYNDLMTVEKDANGNISLFETNSVLVNQLARDTAEKTQQNLQTAKDISIDIPLGQLTGIAFFANTGPKVSVKLYPYESVNCHFLSEFEEAGINQTRHKIFLNVVANIQVILPTSNKTITTTAEVLICESLLVGKVPEIYLSMGNFGGNLDLIP